MTNRPGDHALAETGCYHRPPEPARSVAGGTPRGAFHQCERVRLDGGTRNEPAPCPPRIFDRQIFGPRTRPRMTSPMKSAWSLALGSFLVQASSNLKGYQFGYQPGVRDAS